MLPAVFAVALLFAARDYGQRAANRSYDHLLVHLSRVLPAVFAVALLFAARDYGQRAANRSYDH
ncbi:hypothetical protein C7E18_24490, partial [Stenotrophomonas maltophilia]